MANFGQLIITNLGIQEQYKALSGIPLKFKRIALGSGNFSGNIKTLTELVTENVSVAISKGYIQNDAYTVEGFFSNDDLQTGFAWREIGLFVEDQDGNEILYCYSNAGETYDYIPATTDERYSKYIRIATAIGNATNVSFIKSEGFIYVDLRTFNDAINGLKGLFSAYVETANIPSTSWVGTKEPYYAEVQIEKITGDENEIVKVIVPYEATLEQKIAWSRAGIISGKNELGKIVLEAIGEKPTIDIPILACINSSGSGGSGSIGSGDGHTHENLDVLDTITAEKVAEWNAGTGGGSCDCGSITDTEIDEIVSSDFPPVEPGTGGTYTPISDEQIDEVVGYSGSDSEGNAVKPITDEQIEELVNKANGGV